LPRVGLAAQYAGKLCSGCPYQIAARDKLSRTRDGWWWHGRPGSVEHVALEPGLPAVVHNSRRSTAGGALAARRSRSTKPRRRRRGGGRPETFIAALVVARAAELYKAHRRWVDVLQALKAEGNGTYARNTLIRRVRKFSRGQNSADGAGDLGELEQLQRRAKTRRRRRR
jgi:hypothetical protein